MFLPLNVNSYAFYCWILNIKSFMFSLLNVNSYAFYFEVLNVKSFMFFTVAFFSVSYRAGAADH